MRKRKRDVRESSKPLLTRILRPRRSSKRTVVGRKPAVDAKKRRPTVGPPQRRSRLEDRVEGLLLERGIAYEYESHVIEYIVPESKHKYTPDFNLEAVHLETKGKFTPADRKKMLNVRNSNPDTLLIMVFPQPNNRLRKGSKTTYADWCDKNGLPWLSVEQLEQILERDDYYDYLRQVAQGVELQRR